MTKILLCVTLFCLLESIAACSSFRDPWTTSPCSTPVDTCCSMTYPPNVGSNCGCSTCDSPCSKKTYCVCEIYEAKPCQCSSCDCLKSSLCFPEVEYPVMVMETRPCCYRSCWSA